MLDIGVQERIAFETGQAILVVRDEMIRPCYMLRPRLSIDGDKWCALYGDNLQDGVAGFGESPNKAFLDFDRAWYASLDRAV